MFLTTFLSILTLLAFTVPGFIGRKVGKIKDTGALVYVLSYVAQPFLIISSMQSCALTPENTVKLGVSALVALICHAIVLFVSVVVFRYDRSKGSKAYVLASTFSNCGFMGIPVIQSLIADGHLGNDALLCTTAYIFVFNFLTWTVGNYVLTGDKSHISVKRFLFNPPTLAGLFVGLPLYFLNVTLPDWAIRGVDFLGNMSAPISMIILGVRLADMSLKELFLDGGAYLATLMKLVIVPLLCLLVMLPFKAMMGDTVNKVIYIGMAMPAAGTVLTMAELYGTKPDCEKASKVQSLSTVLSVITVPLLMMI